MEKSVKETLLKRRSIRKYKDQELSPEQVAFIYEAIRNTPTSVNGQQYSVIDITDKKLKQKMSEITAMPQVSQCSHFMLFCADFHKVEVIAANTGIKLADFHDTAEGLLVGTVDAALAMMSAIVAANSLGLGTCCIGYSRLADPLKTSELVDLPKSVYIVCGLCIGIPDELPDIKPKEPTNILIHSNKYASDDEILEEMTKYNTLIKNYNATRAGNKSDTDWINRIAGYYEAASQLQIREILRQRGFSFDH